MSWWQKIHQTIQQEAHHQSAPRSKRLTQQPTDRLALGTTGAVYYTAPWQWRRIEIEIALTSPAPVDMTDPTWPLAFGLLSYRYGVLAATPPTATQSAIQSIQSPVTTVSLFRPLLSSGSLSPAVGRFRFSAPPSFLIHPLSDNVAHRHTTLHRQTFTTLYTEHGYLPVRCLNGPP